MGTRTISLGIFKDGESIFHTNKLEEDFELSSIFPNGLLIKRIKLEQHDLQEHPNGRTIVFFSMSLEGGSGSGLTVVPTMMLSMGDFALGKKAIYDPERFWIVIDDK